MKAYSIYLTSFLLLILGACTSEENTQNDLGYTVIENPEYGELQNQEPAPFEFVLQDSTVLDLPNDFIVSSISSINVDTAGNIFFMEHRQNKLISLYPDLEFRWMTGQEGRGPGDFESVYSMINDGNHLVVGNQGGNRIDLFDFDGNYIRSYNPNKEINGSTLIGVTENGELVANTSVFEMLGKNIHVIKLHEDSLEVVNSFTIDETGNREIPPGLTLGSPTSVKGNIIISGSINDYSLTFYNTEGEIEKKFNRDIELVLGPGIYTTNTTRSISFFGSVGSPNFLPVNIIMGTAMWPTNIDDPNEYVRRSREGGNVPEAEYRNTIDFYEEGGKLLYSIEADGRQPEIGRIMHVDKEGLVYTFSSTPEPVLYRYRVERI